MTEFEAMVRRALIDNLHGEYDELLSAELPWPQSSARHRRWEKKLLADPVGFARRQARPVWQKTLRAAACVLLCLATLFGALMAVSPTARAWVVEQAVRWTEQFTEFTFISRNPKGVTEDWRPAYIPEGFVETDVDWIKETHYLEVTYEAEDGRFFIISSIPADQGGSFSVDNEHSVYQEIKINGQTASLFVSNTKDYPNYLVWINSDKTRAFLLASDIELNNMVQIAESCS